MTIFFKLLSVFFNWWWAAVTGVATVIGFFGMLPTITLGRTALAVMLFFGLTLLFLTLSVTVQGYAWYRDGHRSPTVVACTPPESAREPEVFKIQSLIPLQPGQVMSILRSTP